MLKGEIKNWDKFEKIIPNIKKLKFMGDIFTDLNDIKEYAREAYLIKEEIEISY